MEGARENGGAVMTTRLRRLRPLLVFAALLSLFALFAAAVWLGFFLLMTDYAVAEMLGFVLCLTASQSYLWLLSPRLARAYLHWRARRRRYRIARAFGKAADAISQQTAAFNSASATVEAYRVALAQLQPNGGVYRYDDATGAWVRLAACERAGEGEDE